MSSSRKRRLIEEIAAQCEVGVGDIEDAYPCTPMQRGAALASVANPGMLFTHFTWKLNRDVSSKLDRVQECVRKVWERTPTLRTRIVCVNAGDGQERLLQAVVQDSISWTSFSDLDGYREQLSRCPLRFGAPLARLAVSQDRDYMVCTLHHSLYDAWSLSLVWSDLAAVWEAGAYGAASGPRKPFSKFCAFLEAGIPDASVRFWKGQLENYSGPSYAVQTTEPDTNVLLTGEFPVARNRSDTISPTVAARVAWACTLMELFGTNDILFLEITTGRNCPVDGIEEIIGPTITTIPVRLRRSPDEGLFSSLWKTQAQSADLLKHEHGYTSAYDALISEQKRPRHILNVMNKMQSQRPEKKAPLSRIGLEDITDLSSQKNSADWGLNLEMHEERIVWSFYADNRRLPQQSIDTMTTRFPEWMRQCVDVIRG